MMFSLQPPSRSARQGSTTAVSPLSSRPLILPFVALVLSGSIAGCELDGTPAEPVPPVTPPSIEDLPVSWAHPALQEIVELQVRRDGEALRELLAADDPAVRARAALALASVQDGDAVVDLLGLLADQESPVRREAAFALGQLELADGPEEALAAALEEERDPGVRRRIIEALGKRGGGVAAGVLLDVEARDPDEEAVLALALARLGVRQVLPDGLVDALLERIVHPEPEVRRMAAYYFGNSPDTEPWTESVERVREALDGYAADDPAAMHLLIGLGLRRDRAERDRLLHWLRGGEDWRIRVNAARAMATTSMLGAEGVRDALFERVRSDPSQHVASAAAHTLTMGFLLPDAVLERMTREMLEGPRDRWRVYLPFVEHLAMRERLDDILAWGRRMERGHPLAVTWAIRWLSVPAAGEGIEEFLEAMLRHRDAQVRAAALGSLASRATVLPGAEGRVEDLMDEFARALEGGAVPEVIQVLRVLSSPSWIPLGSRELVAGGLAAVETDAPPSVVVAYLNALAEIGGDDAPALAQRYLDDPDPMVRAAAEEAHRVFTGERGLRTDDPRTGRTLDWQALETLGPAPRLHLETDRGEIVVRLRPDQAPLTVQVVAELANGGAYDGTPFHRIESNFVVQGGDVLMGDGSGFPGFTLPSEFGRIPFLRGVVGMASSGKDTEGSEFFLTHSMQPHLDGYHTAFGWIESGEEALDRLLMGDRLQRARVVPGVEG